MWLTVLTRATASNLVVVRNRVSLQQSFTLKVSAQYKERGKFVLFLCVCNNSSSRKLSFPGYTFFFVKDTRSSQEPRIFCCDYMQHSLPLDSFFV